MQCFRAVYGSATPRQIQYEENAQGSVLNFLLRFPVALISVWFSDISLSIRLALRFFCLTLYNVEGQIS